LCQTFFFTLYKFQIHLFSAIFSVSFLYPEAMSAPSIKKLFMDINPPPSDSLARSDGALSQSSSQASSADSSTSTSDEAPLFMGAPLVDRLWILNNFTQAGPKMYLPVLVPASANTAPFELARMYTWTLNAQGVVEVKLPANGTINAYHWQFPFAPSARVALLVQTAFLAVGFNDIRTEAEPLIKGLSSTDSRTPIVPDLYEYDLEPCPTKPGTFVFAASAPSQAPLPPAVAGAAAPPQDHLTQALALVGSAQSERKGNGREERRGKEREERE
jgi:hypothetical protein